MVALLLCLCSCDDHAKMNLFGETTMGCNGEGFRAVRLARHALPNWQLQRHPGLQFLGAVGKV